MKAKQQHYILRLKASTGRVFDAAICVSSDFLSEYDSDNQMRQDVESVLYSLYGFEVCSKAFTSYWYPISCKDAREYYYATFRF